jgi:cysteine desulfurase/selenocysteine lyase
MTININTPASGEFDLLDIHLVESLANEIYAGTPERVTTVKKQTVEIRSQQATLTEKLPDNSVKTGAAQLPTIPDTVPSAALDSMVEELSKAIASPDFHLQKALSGLKGAPTPTASIPTPNGEIPGSVPSFYFLPTAIPKADSFPVANARDIFDVEAIRQDFPILHQRVNGKPLIWFDNAATTQKPQSVIDALSHFYEQDNSNIHRAAHTLAARSTQGYEDARSKIQHFLGATSADEIIFARGTTEAINLVAQTYGRKFIEPGDEILLTNLEHHANIVPWQMLAQEKGAVLKVVPVNDQGEIILEEYGRLLSSRTKLVGLTQVSNAIGTILPVQEMTAMAHRYGARVLIDGAQSVSHIPVNVQTLNCDFYTFSGHKIFGPTGIGVLYGKRELLEDMPPWQGGGSMIRNVTFAETIYSEIPAKFEAGTPNIGDAIGLGYAIDYVTRLGLVNIERYEQKLTRYATERLAKVPGLRQIGTAAHKVGVLSFVLDGMNTEEVGKKLDREGIAVRAGHHCAQPTMQRFGLTGTVRPALAFYNTCAEIDRLIDVLHHIRHRY